MALLATEQFTGGDVRDADSRRVVAVEGPGGGSVPISGNITAVSSDPTASALGPGVGTFTAGASAQLVAVTLARKGLQVTVDPAAAATVYFLLGAGTASATNFHFALSAGGSWDGTVSNTVWTGAVQFFSSGTPKVGVAEV